MKHKNTSLSEKKIPEAEERTISLIFLPKRNYPIQNYFKEREIQMKWEWIVPIQWTILWQSC